MKPVLSIRNLRIEGRMPNGEFSPIVKGVSVEVRRGEVLALIGQSGSGKSTIGLAALGYARPGCKIVGGQVLLNGVDVIGLDRDGRLKIRGTKVAYVAQSAAASFNPALTIGFQVTEGLWVHGLLGEDAAYDRALDLYRRLGLPNPETIGLKYPHQVSGGQLQRLMVAMAMSCWPDVLVLDEPTTALDVTTQLGVLDTFKQAIKQKDSASIYITHDLAVVAQIADRIAVLYNGSVVETGTTGKILHDPEHEYTKLLMAAHRKPPGVKSSGLRDRSDKTGLDNILSVRSLNAGYRGWGGKAPETLVLRDVNIDVPRGQVVGVIGESGSGKSTLAKVIAGLLPPTAGDIVLDGVSLSPSVNMRSKADLRRIQLVSQMPDVSFNPKTTVGAALERPLEFYYQMPKEARRNKVDELLTMVELPTAYGSRYPAKLSGGEKQRVNLARALAAEPEIVLCDEVTSALDTVVAASVIDLLKRLRMNSNLSFIFISHDLSTIALLADRITVMYAGRVVEQGLTGDVLSPPFHPYTSLLLTSVPELRQGWLEDVNRSADTGGITDFSKVGCPFFGRCPLRMPGVCDVTEPPVHSLDGHTIACHRSIGELMGA